MSDKKIYYVYEFREKLKEAFDAALAGETIYIDRNRVLFRLRVDKKSIKKELK